MAGAVSAVHVLSTAGKLLISRDFRGDVPSSCVDRFLSLVLDAETEAELKPVMYDEGLSYTYVTHNNLYLLAVSRANVNAVATLYFLHRLVDVFTHYFEARWRQRSSASCGAAARGVIPLRTAHALTPPLAAGAGRGVAERQLCYWCVLLRASRRAYTRRRAHTLARPSVRVV